MPRLFKDRIGTTKLSLFMMSVAVLALFCFAAVPSAKATVTTYTVQLTTTPAGDSGSPATAGCTSGTGTITINSGNATTADDTFEFVSANCYFGGVSATPTAGTTKTTFGYGPSGVGDCLTNCSKLDPTDLATDTAQYTFQSTSAVPDVGDCGGSPTPVCSTAETNINFALKVPHTFDANTAANASELSSSTVDGNPGINVYFYDAVVVTPEPMSYLLFGSGLLLLGVISRKKLGLGRPAA